MNTQENRLKIFNKIISLTPQHDYYYLFIFHLSRNNFLYLEKWITSVKTLGVISIPYSEQEDVRKNIENKTTLYRTELKNIPALIVKLCNEHKDKKIILVEIGGYSAGVADKLSNVVLAVEDTNRGHWNFLEHEKKLTFPVVSMAQARVKYIENTLIGTSITYSFETILRDTFNQEFIVGKNVLVLSYGGIGSAVCRALTGRNARIFVYDKDPIKMFQAYIDGYNIVDKKQFLGKADAIIGATGNRSITEDELPLLKNNVLLISGSSRQIEFPYEKMENFVTKDTKGKLVEKVKLGKKEIFIAHKGQPVNFYHDSSLGDIFDAQMALLAQCINYGLTHKLENKVYKLPEDQEYQIAELYIKNKLTS